MLRYTGLMHCLSSIKPTLDPPLRAQTANRVLQGLTMASHEDFYSSSRSVSQNFPAATQISTSAAPPPPPPKPTPHAYSQSQDPSRTGTPNLIHSSGPPPPPLPPTPRSTSASNSPRPPPPLPTSPSHSSSLPTTHQFKSIQSYQQSQIQPPSLSEHWLPSEPVLQNHITSDLHPILQNPSLLNALSQTHPSYASSLIPLNAQLDANVQLSAQLSALATQISTLRHHTSQLLLQNSSLQQTWRRKQSEMDDALSPWGPRAMYQRLVSSINEQEALLRAVQESFLEGDGDGEYYNGGSNGGKAGEKQVNEWVRRIREGTTVLEKRREMRARWDEGRVGGWR